MKKRNILLILCVFLAILTVSAVSVSAQDIDVENMDKTELMQLLQAIMQKLEDGETEEVPEPASIESTDPEPTALPESEITEAIAEAVNFHIYTNKKLTLERIPDDRFIQKDNGKKDPDKKTPHKKNTPEHYNNEPDIDEHGVECHWYFVDGKWYCMYG